MLYLLLTYMIDYQERYLHASIVGMACEHLIYVDVDVNPIFSLSSWPWHGGRLASRVGWSDRSGTWAWTYGIYIAAKSGFAFLRVVGSGGWPARKSALCLQIGDLPRRSDHHLPVVVILYGPWGNCFCLSMARSRSRLVSMPHRAGLLRSSITLPTMLVCCYSCSARALLTHFWC